MNGLILSTKFEQKPIDVCLFSDEPYFFVSQVARALEYSRPENLYTPILKSWREFFEPNEVLKFEKETAEALSLSTEGRPKHYSFILLIHKFGLLTLLAKTGKKKRHAFRKFLKKTILPELDSLEISSKNQPKIELTISSFLRSKGVSLTPTNRRTFGIAVAREYRRTRKRDPPKVIRGSASLNAYSKEDLEIFERAFKEWE